MKTALVGTTIMASAAVLITPTASLMAAPIKAEVRGYHREYFAGAYQDIDPVPGGDDVDVAYFDHHFDNEIHFRGETTLDNGLTFGFRVELEGRTDDDQIDEAYIYVDGDNFGRFVIGDENSAAYLMHNRAPSATTIDVNENDLERINILLPGSFDSRDTPIDATLLRANDNDSGKIMYFTPRVAGFQFGISYAAIAESGGSDNSSDRTGDQWNNISLGLDFVEDFNGVGFGLQGGFVYADTSQAGPADDADDLYGVNASTFVALDGWTIGGAFAYLEGDEGVEGGRGTDTERALQYDGFAYNLGTTYETGAWTFGLTYMRGKNSGLQGDGERNTFDQYMAGIVYNLGSGVDLELTGIYYDADGEKRDLPGVEESDFIRTNGYGAATSIALTF